MILERYGRMLLALGVCGFCQILHAQTAYAATTTTTSSGMGTLYQMYKGAYLKPPCLASAQNVGSKGVCVALCRRHASCKAGSYHVTHKTCCLSDSPLPLLNKNLTYAKDDAGWYFQLPFDYDGWTLVFKADAHANLAFLDSWNNNSHHDSLEVGKREFERGCLNADGSKTCTSNFRSKYLDDWETSNIKQVSYRLYKNGENVVNIIFNGTGSTMTSWMSPSRLLQTPWTDMTTSSSNYNLFGVDPYPSHRRCFFINKSYGGCGKDVGWVVVVDRYNSKTPCKWETYPPYPAFRYSTEKTAVNWNDAADSADVLAIFVKF